MTFDLGPNIVFWHSNCFFDIQTGPYITFWHSKSYLDIHIRAGYHHILIFLIFLFYIRTGTDYRIMIFEILFWHSNWGRVLRFYTWYPILTFKLGENIAFCQSKSYFDIRTWAEYRVWHLKSYLAFEFGPNIAFRCSISYFVIWIEAEYRILTFEVLFWHSNLHRISYLNIRKSYFNIWIRAEYRILTFEFLFLHSNSGRMSHFNIRINFMTLELRPNILFWHSKCWFDILTGAKYYIFIFEFLIYNVTWEIGPNISFWNSKFCFDIRI